MRVLHLLFLMLFTSCALIDVDFHMPNHRFMTPETAGEGIVDNKFSGSFGAGFTRSNKVTLAEAYDAVIFSTSTVNDDDSVDPSAGMTIDGSLGIVERVDFFARLNYDTPATFGFKFQFLGDPRVKRKQGWKGAVALAYGSSEKDEGTVTVDDNLSSSRTYNATIDSSVTEAHLIFGNRVSPSLLVYLSGMYSYYQVESELTSNTFATVRDDGVARNYGGSLGARLEKFETGFYVSSEFGVMRGTWENSGGETAFTYGAQLGFAF